jgi:hypothetical protein
MDTRPRILEKLLSPNDTGETGGHQAGILVPKQAEILSFFPVLDSSQKNPRIQISFNDEFGCVWLFSFIHYNNKFFEGTRNEYRLTGMTKFFRAMNLTSGDTLKLTRDDDGAYNVRFTKIKSIQDSEGPKLKLGNSWKVVKI